MAVRLAALARDDKWFLSAGDGMIWAPPFPVWLHRPGFWDEAHIHSHAFAPLFSVAVLDRYEHELRLERSRWHWEPGSITVQWRTPVGATLTERREVLPGGRFRSAWTIESDPDRALAAAHLVAFTAQPGGEVAAVGSAEGDGVWWQRHLIDSRGDALRVTATLRAAPQPVGRSALRAEPAALQPEWCLTPFAERWRGGLANDVRLEGISSDGFVYAAVDVPLDGVQGHPVAITLEITPGDSRRPDRPAARSPGERDGEGEAVWTAFFERFPRFACSDEHLSRYYDYRVYGLHLNRLPGGVGHLRHPTIAEGIGYFHVPIAYSAPCHMAEMRWANPPDEARGALLNFLDRQKADGSFHGRLDPFRLAGAVFYHANWGDATLGVEALHPDAGFLERAYEGLTRYARWLDRTRDSEQSGMYDIVNQYETGQEYMSRYAAVDPDADRNGWHHRIRLKGIDVTVYAYQLKRALAEMAIRLDRSRQASAWHDGAGRIAEAITGTMWDAERGLFSDVDPRNGTRTGVKAAVCFYPLLTDLLNDAMVRVLLEHLEDTGEFATPFPVPSTSLDDPLFDAHAAWKGKRHNCPWNGRVWPMTNSHVVEGLLRQWHGGRRFVGRLAAELLVRFVRMMFHDRDPARPNCYEHYNPFTGHPSVYRGIDDYQHSWVLDLLIRGVAGIEPTPEGVRIDPLPVVVDSVELDGCIVRGRQIDLRRDGADICVRVDGHEHRTVVGTPLEIPC